MVSAEVAGPRSFRCLLTHCALKREAAIKAFARKAKPTKIRLRTKAVIKNDVATGDRIALMATGMSKMAAGLTDLAARWVVAHGQSPSPLRRFDRARRVGLAPGHVSRWPIDRRDRLTGQASHVYT